LRLAVEEFPVFIGGAVLVILNGRHSADSMLSVGWVAACDAWLAERLSIPSCPSKPRDSPIAGCGVDAVERNSVVAGVPLFARGGCADFSENKSANPPGLDRGVDGRFGGEFVPSNCLSRPELAIPD
jgi:hypothetical protein